MKIRYVVEIKNEEGYSTLQFKKWNLFWVTPHFKVFGDGGWFKQFYISKDEDQILKEFLIDKNYISNNKVFIYPSVYKIASTKNYFNI